MRRMRVRPHPPQCAVVAVGYPLGAASVTVTRGVAKRLHPRAPPPRRPECASSPPPSVRLLPAAPEGASYPPPQGAALRRACLPHASLCLCPGYRRFPWGSRRGHQPRQFGGASIRSIHQFGRRRRFCRRAARPRRRVHHPGDGRAPLPRPPRADGPPLLRHTAAARHREEPLGTQEKLAHAHAMVMS